MDGAVTRQAPRPPSVPGGGSDEEEEEDCCCCCCVACEERPDFPPSPSPPFPETAAAVRALFLASVVHARDVSEPSAPPAFVESSWLLCACCIRCKTCEDFGERAGWQYGKVVVG